MSVLDGGWGITKQRQTVVYKEHIGDMWRVDADAVVITTNGRTNMYGLAIMGRGCAKEASDKFPKLPIELGERIRHFGNIPFAFPLTVHAGYVKPIITLPVKHHWQEPADINLIWRGMNKLVPIVEALGLSTVAMPRPGCGNGQLDWEDMKDEMGVVLTGSPTTFIVCHKEGS